jgi:hypothetical protein
MDTFIREFTAEWNRLLAERSGDRAVRERELAQVQRKLAGLIGKRPAAAPCAGARRYLSMRAWTRLQRA